MKDSITHDSFTARTKLNLKNVEKMTPVKPGAIILYDKSGHINNLIVAEKSIKDELIAAVWDNSSVYFSFRETEKFLNINSIVIV